MSSQRIRVLLFGLGSIGGFYAFILQRNEDIELSVVARSNYDTVKTQGLKIESYHHGTQEAQFDHVFKSVEEATGPFEFIVCAHKAINTQSIFPSFRHLVDDQTTFVLLQNGVGNEDPVRELYPRNTIISCSVWTGAHQKSPGVVQVTASEKLLIGLFRNSSLDQDLEQKRLQTFGGFLKTGQTAYQIEDDIQIARWEKVIWNAAWNPLTTLTSIDTHTWLASSHEATAMTRRLMAEVMMVGRRCGVSLRDELPDQLIAKMLAIAPVITSMQVDARENRPLELDVILGYPVQKAREWKMDLPVLFMVYALTNAVNARIQQHQS